MIIGNGLLAQRFAANQKNKQVLIFASGVSDSKSMDTNEFERERILLKSTLEVHPECLFVYFSTCSIYDSFLKSKPYVMHKIEMEDLIARSADAYQIFRLSNVAGPGGNPKTIFHFLARAIKEETHFDLWSLAHRNLIDVDDVFLLVDYLVKNGERNEIFNIANPVSFHLPEIVSTMEEYFNKKGNYTWLEAGHFFDIDTSRVESISAPALVNFNGDYLRRLLSKYYPM